MHSTLNEPHIIHTKIFSDSRGNFREALNIMQPPFDAELLTYRQQNISVNKKNVFRGMHYQLKYPQGKLVTILSGSVIDYIIDLREWSPNFKEVSKYFLSADDPEQSTLWVPPGFAHGFHALINNTIFCYNVFYNSWIPEDEHCISPDSVDFIQNSIGEAEIILSDKDKNGIHIDEAPFYTK